ncbi:hypothetical protein [Leptospira ilyithenensis]|uniref:Uncharacterized protein n=1 Tax=Leptospira ilyithenensis TaxID=2484901 RepID=A0A4V3JWL9_9LEPT|nr:hypothetical protein [Leptospira ilyithenensis]TGN06498.1 hypothetical protein EHS11_19290 [Leptospira ilyithenensis]
MASRILTLLILTYSLFLLRESYLSYIKFQKFYRKHFENVAAELPPNRSANSILREFAEFPLDPSKCPELFILVPETTSPNQVLIRQVIEYSFTPCEINVKENDWSPNMSSSTLILTSKDKIQNRNSADTIVQTSKNYNLFQIKP